MREIAFLKNDMTDNYAYTTIKGKWVKVPAFKIEDKTVIVTGGLMKKAEIHDEEWLDSEPLNDANVFMQALRRQKIRADFFTFTEGIGSTNPKYRYHLEWDNAAVIDTTDFKKWWEQNLPQVTRKNIRRAEKRGLVTRVFELNETTIKQIFDLYQQIQTKQGAVFAHRGKDLETVRKEISTFARRSGFIGAYYDEELVGFIKLVYMGKKAGIMHIVSKDTDYDKRPANALIAKAVEICNGKGCSLLLYGKYIYGNKTKSGLTEYKRRNGFEKLLFPRYFVPLSFKGRIFILLGLHKGLLGILPPRVINVLLNARANARRVFNNPQLLLRSKENVKDHHERSAEGEKVGAN
jgi:hypothetical protein